MPIIETGSNIKRIFVSAETTGTGGAQNIAHGLGAIPTGVIIALTTFGTAESPVVVEGSHTSTNIVVTVASSTVKFKAIAWV